VLYVLVVSQALLQAHDPNIQAKLLAMQRQIGGSIPADNAASPLSGQSLLSHDLSASASALRHNRMMTAEQKEEQTRCVSW